MSERELRKEAAAVIRTLQKSYDCSVFMAEGFAILKAVSKTNRESHYRLVNGLPNLYEHRPMEVLQILIRAAGNE